MSTPFSLRAQTPEDVEALVELSLLTWAPVFESFRSILGEELFTRMYPEGVHQQRGLIEGYCVNEEAVVCVCVCENELAGYVVYTINADEGSGVIELLAVHPRFHSRGIGTALNEAALTAMRAQGVALASVSTGGDPAHAAARRSYEKAGFTPLPVINFFQKL